MRMKSFYTGTVPFVGRYVLLHRRRLAARSALLAGPHQSSTACFIYQEPARILMTQAQNSCTEQAPGLSYCIPLINHHPIMVLCFYRRDLRGKELLDKLGLTVRGGFTVNKSDVPQETCCCWLQVVCSGVEGFNT